MEKRANMMYDTYAFKLDGKSVASNVNRNHMEFVARNRAVAREMMEENLRLDQERRERERQAREQDQLRDKEELARVNATKLEYSE